MSVAYEDVLAAQDQYIRYYTEMLEIGDRVRLVNDATGEVAPSLMRRRGTVIGIDFAQSKIDNIMCYLVQMDNRKKSMWLYHDELEKIE